MVDSSSIQQLPINQLQPNPLQPRGVIAPDSIMDLVDSIREHGVLEPLVVAHTPVGFQIIAGERRWRASKMAGLQTVPCIVKETNPQRMLEMAIVENVQREDLNAIERAKAFNRLQIEFGLNSVEIAKQVSKSVSYVANTLKLLELPDAIKDGLISGLISEGHARALQAIKDPRSMVSGYKQVLKESASVRRAEEIARRMKSMLEAAGKQTYANIPDRVLYYKELDKMRDRLMKKLGERSKVKIIQSKRQVKLTISINGGVAETTERLNKIYEKLSS